MEIAFLAWGCVMVAMLVFSVMVLLGALDP
jgi:hypothetical protein